MRNVVQPHSDYAALSCMHAMQKRDAESAARGEREAQQHQALLAYMDADGNKRVDELEVRKQELEVRRLEAMNQQEALRQSAQRDAERDAFMREMMKMLTGRGAHSPAGME